MATRGTTKAPRRSSTSSKTRRPSSSTRRRSSGTSGSRNSSRKSTSGGTKKSTTGNANSTAKNSSTSGSSGTKSTEKKSSNSFVNSIHDTDNGEKKDAEFKPTSELEQSSAEKNERGSELKDNLLSNWGFDDNGKSGEKNGNAGGSLEVKGNSEVSAADKSEAGSKAKDETAKGGQKTEQPAKPEASKDSQAKDDKSKNDALSKSEGAQSGQEPKKENLDQQLRQDFQSFAKENPQALNKVLEQAYPNASESQRQQLAEQMANGTAPMPENLQFVESEALDGAQAGYSAENGGTISMSRDLLGNPEALGKVYSEEVGHHFDSQFGKGDAPGDEGQILQEGLTKKGSLSEERLSTLRAENDHGQLHQNGRSTAVENSSGRRFDSLNNLGAPGLGGQDFNQNPAGQQGFPGNPPVPGQQAVPGNANGGVDPSTGKPYTGSPSNQPGGQVGDPNRVSGAVQRLANNNNPQMLNDLISHDAKTREAAAQQLGQQLNQMDPATREQAIQDLSRIAGVPEEVMATELHRGQQQSMRMSAMQALESYGLDNLSTEQLDTLSGALSDTELPGMQATKMFGRMAADPVRTPNNQYATETLRNLTQVKDDFNTSGRAADALSYAEGTAQFQKADYQRLVDGAKNNSYGSGQRAQRVLGEAAGLDTDKPGNARRQEMAMDTLRDNLASESAGGDRHRVAADAMGQATNNMTGEDSELLGGVAAHSSDVASRSALETLQKAALREDGGPVDGAANAISETLDETAFEQGSDKHKMASETARNTFSKGNDDVRSDIANNIFRADSLDNKQAGEALDILRTRVGENAKDLKAIDGLGHAMNSEGVSHGNRLVATDALGDTAGKGSEEARELLTDALHSGLGNLLDGGHFTSEQSDEALNWMGARGLGRAAKAGDNESLQALKDGYSQGVERGDRGEFTADAAMNQLGQLGSEWGKDNQQGEGVRSFVRDALGQGDGRAANAMEKMAQNLGDKDVNALLAQLDNPGSDDIRLNSGVDGALEAVVDKQPDAHGRQVLDHVRGRLEKDPLRSMSTMGELANHLSTQDVQELGKQIEGDYPDRAIDTLAKINSSTDNNAVKMEAAKKLVEPDNFGQLDQNQRRDLVDTVALNGSQQMKDQLRNQLGVEAPMSVEALEKIGQEFNTEVNDRIKRALDRDPARRTAVQRDLVELANLSHAQAIANDKDNENSSRIDKAKLKEKLEAVSARLGPEFEKMRTEIQERHSGIGEKQGDFLQSQDFRDVLRLTPANERAHVAQAELAKLQAVDPARAQELKGKLSDQLRLMQAQEADNSLRLFQGQSSQVQAQTIDGINQALFGNQDQTAEQGGGLVADTVGGAGKANQVAGRSANALKAVDAHNIAKLLGQVDPNKIGSASELSKVFRGNFQEMASTLSDTVRRLEEAGDSEGLAKAKGALSSLNRIKEWAAKVDEVGGWGSISAGLGVTSLALGGMPKNLEETARAGTSVMSIAGNMDDVGKLAFTGTRAVAQSVFGAGSKVDDLAKLGSMQGVSKGLKAMKWMGPLSDLGSAALDGYASYNEFQKGDFHGGVGMGISAGGSALAGAAGLALLAGASGPAAPIVLIGGTVIGIGGMIYNAKYGMDQEQEFLNGLGVYNHPY